MSTLIGVEQDLDQKHTQVFYATHESKIIENGGASAAVWLRKSFRDRSFISFSYGGRWIEDFNLIAVNNGDRYIKALLPTFEDFTTDYAVVDGKIYWGSHYTDNQLVFTLATDGMTQEQLEDFQHWFVPGEPKELILAEHPNRYIQARVNTTPNMSVIPFEEIVKTKINGREYEASTNLYKGTISLSFAFDDLFWKSKYMYFGMAQSPNSEIWEENWTDANGNIVNVFDDKDAIKIMMEDRIPTLSMLPRGLLLGNNYSVNDNFSIIGEAGLSGEQTEAGNITDDNGTAIAAASDIDRAVGFVGPRLNDSGLLSLTSSKPLYCFYPGTAPMQPTISFTINPKMDTTAPYYITVPNNSIATDENENPYNRIIFTGKKVYDLKFTLSNFYYNYNKGQQILYNYLQSNKSSFVEMRQLIREQITHKIVKEWFIKALDQVEEQVNIDSNYSIDDHIYQICAALCIQSSSDSNIVTYPVTYEINNKLGLINATITCREITNQLPTSISSISNENARDSFVENAADMLKSDFLQLPERNHFNSDGFVAQWADTNNETRTYTYHITTDSTIPLNNFMINYDYLYY